MLPRCMVSQPLDSTPRGTPHWFTHHLFGRWTHSSGRCCYYAQVSLRGATPWLLYRRVMGCRVHHVSSAWQLCDPTDRALPASDRANASQPVMAMSPADVSWVHVPGLHCQHRQQHCFDPKREPPPSGAFSRSSPAGTGLLWVANKARRPTSPTVWPPWKTT